MFILKEMFIYQTTTTREVKNKQTKQQTKTT